MICKEGEEGISKDHSHKVIIPNNKTNQISLNLTIQINLKPTQLQQDINESDPTTLQAKYIFAALPISFAEILDPKLPTDDFEKIVT
jgi:hypothetical protein